MLEHNNEEREEQPEGQDSSGEIVDTGMYALECETCEGEKCVLSAGEFVQTPEVVAIREALGLEQLEMMQVKTGEAAFRILRGDNGTSPMQVGSNAAYRQGWERIFESSEN